MSRNDGNDLLLISNILREGKQSMFSTSKKDLKNGSQKGTVDKGEFYDPDLESLDDYEP